jgi:hypothetical protein
MGPWVGVGPVGPGYRLAVTVYSPPMTGNRPELSGSHWGFEIVNPVVAQWETSNNLACLILVRRTTASLKATALEPGIAAAARVEPTPAKIGPTKVEATTGIGPTEPAEIEIATRVITAAGVVAGEAYVAAAGG